ncbi:hypothetical protein [Micromonospora sp. NBC_01638]|uniref:hypothetical protein n=1 Tax=Micromonospora sp. NBC_01638 TaxID=2975982 RepID=UPI00386E3EA6|nr:hypothetical protein OG811_32045 [Micromonospora sp. NBC_01638]
MDIETRSATHLKLNTYGLRLTYQPETQTVRAEMDLNAHRGVMVCVRGATRTETPRPLVLTTEFLLGRGE